jgi:hypothetical protein
MTFLQSPSAPTRVRTSTPPSRVREHFVLCPHQQRACWTVKLYILELNSFVVWPALIRRQRMRRERKMGEGEEQEKEREVVS